MIGVTLVLGQLGAPPRAGAAKYQGARVPDPQTHRINNAQLGWRAAMARPWCGAKQSFMSQRSKLSPLLSPADLSRIC